MEVTIKTTKPYYLVEDNTREFCLLWQKCERLSFETHPQPGRNISPMLFLPPLADASNFPAPSIRALPAVKWHSNSTPVAKMSGQQRLIYAKARHALYHIALSSARNRVWLPAYHCPALVEPFLAAGKTILFYPLNATLTPCLVHLQREVKSGDMVVAVRYFGFDCGVEELAVLCQENNCLLIEDLAHAALTKKLYGDLAVTSLVKFYPISTGAELWLPDECESGEVIKKNYYALQGEMVEQFTRLVKKVGGKVFSSTKPTFRYFDVKAVSRCISSADKAYLDHPPAAWVSEKRREHYQQLSKSIQGSSWGNVLFERLPENVSPYVLPFLLNETAGFDHLRNHGIEIYRWEEIVPGKCETSLDYRQRLVQLPCHQDLSSKQLDTIAEILH